jgi:RNA polymerase sigma-70 factor (ECF subfamily)
MDDASQDLLARCREGDSQAAAELFHRYTEQLISLARRNLSPKLARRLDPEDVVQSAYRSFFADVRAGRYVLERSGDLWRLLAAITLHKLHHQVGRHTAARRSVERERGFGDESSLFGLPAATVARTPSPEEAVIVVDELECAMRGMNSLHRRMVELRLQGCRFQEIATDTDRSERLVRRVLDQFRQRLDERYRKPLAE